MVDRNFFLALMAFAFFLAYSFLVFVILAPLSGALIWAAVFGVATYPLYQRLRRRLNGRHTLAAAIMTPVVILLLAIPIVLVALFLAVEIGSFYEAIQLRVLTGDYPNLEGLGNWPFVTTILEFLRPISEIIDIDPQETLAPALQNVISALVGKAQNIAQGIFLLALQGAVMAITLFFFFRDGERLFSIFSSLVPLPEDRKAVLLGRTREVLSAVLYGVFFTALVQGNLAALGYWIVGLTSPVLLGLLTAFASIVPPLGTALVWFPAALYLLISGKAGSGIILLAWGALVVASSDNLMRPYFISGRGKISFLAVLLGILGGLATLGLAGMVIGPVILG
ncbi:MAG: AI-2E family transporter, partial [Desulfuromonadales bacterium]